MLISHILLSLLIYLLFPAVFGIIYFFGFWWLTAVAGIYISMCIGGEELRQKLKTEAEEAKKEAEASGKT